MAESLDTILGLRHVGPKQGVLLQTSLVFDDRSGHSQPLERSHRELEVLGLSARVCVIDDRLGGDLEHFVQCRDPRGNVYRLDVRLPLGGGVRQGAAPHAVKLSIPRR